MFELRGSRFILHECNEYKYRNRCNVQYHTQHRAKRGRRETQKKKKWIDTHVNVNPGNIEDLGRRLLAGRVTVELVPAAVPLEGVKRRLLEIVMAAENHLLTTFRYLRNYF